MDVQEYFTPHETTEKVEDDGSLLLPCVVLTLGKKLFLLVVEELSSSYCIWLNAKKIFDKYTDEYQSLGRNTIGRKQNEQKSRKKSQ
jgi:hypothetical protein